MDFETIIQHLANGHTISQYEITPFLQAEKLHDRINYNYILAKTCYGSPNELIRSYAVDFIQRAMLLSDYSNEILPLYETIMTSACKAELLREAYKRIGISALNSGDFDTAVNLFNKWQYTFSSIDKQDKFFYDSDIMQHFEAFAARYRIPERDTPGNTTGRKIKIVYLMKGICEFNSVLIKLMKYYAQHHDRERFEVMFAVPESINELSSSLQGIDHVRFFHENGFSVMGTPDNGTLLERLLNLSAGIAAFNADILVTGCAMGLFNHYFLAALKPARKIVSFILGPLPLFAPYFADWSIAGFKQYQIETPGDCTYIPNEVELPAVPATSLQRGDLDLPENAIILCSAGRPEKLQTPIFRDMIISALRENPNLYFLMIGQGEKPFGHCTNLPAELHERTRAIPWCTGYLDYINLADIFLDTYPTGGAVILLDTMAIGKPVITFTHNYMRIYDQSEASNDDNFFIIRDLVLDRNTPEEATVLIKKLVDNREYRLDIGQKQQQMVFEINGNPERMVKRTEQVYRDILNSRHPCNRQFLLWENEPETNRQIQKLIQDAEEFISKGDLPSAQSLLFIALQSSPEDTNVMHVLATIELELGNLENARSLLQYILELHPGDTQATERLEEL